MAPGSPSRPATSCWHRRSGIVSYASCCGTGTPSSPGAFDNLFRSEGAEILLSPVQAPKANASAERWIGTVRAECLDWLLIVGHDHLEQVLGVYVEHDNQHRPHRALSLEAPDPPTELSVAATDRQGKVHRRDLLGGLLHEYRRAT
jgi:putative transposase